MVWWKVAPGLAAFQLRAPYQETRKAYVIVQVRHHMPTPATSETAQGRRWAKRPRPTQQHISGTRFKDFLRELLIYLAPMYLAVMLIASAVKLSVAVTDRPVVATAGKVRKFPTRSFLLHHSRCCICDGPVLHLLKQRQMVYDFRQRLIHQSLNLRAEACQSGTPGDYRSINETYQLRTTCYPLR